jgi:hypothetical protein
LDLCRSIKSPIDYQYITKKFEEKSIDLSTEQLTLLLKTIEQKQFVSLKPIFSRYLITAHIEEIDLFLKEGGYIAIYEKEINDLSKQIELEKLGHQKLLYEIKVSKRQLFFNWTTILLSLVSTTISLIAIIRTLK